MSEYQNYGLMWDDDHKHLIGGCFAPNGDWYLTMQEIGENDLRTFPMSFRISLSGSQIPDDIKEKLIEIIKQLPKQEEI